MRIPLLFCAMLITHVLGLPQSTTTDGNEITVVSFKWFKTQRTDTARPASSGATREVIQANKNFDRNGRINDPAGKLDPNEGTLDNRRDALDRANEAARNTPPKGADAFAYVAKIHNGSNQTVETVFWEYRFTDAADAANATRRQFVCRASLKPNKDKELQAISLSGSADTVSAMNNGHPLQEKAVINRVEFAGGTNWQRSDWDIKEILTTYDKAMSRPWGANEMCRGL